MADRPDVPAMDDIEDTLWHIEEAEEYVKGAKSRLRELPYEMARQIPGKIERSRAAEYLYWEIDMIPVDAIVGALLPPGMTRHIFKASNDSVRCSGCGQHICITSRAHFKRVRGDKRLLCKACEDEKERKASKEYILRIEAQKSRLAQLASMPYKEYLQTPEWQERRKQHLKSAGYRCQVCNTNGVELNVHHRTYENRGNEKGRDLIVLCENCHAAFHKAGRLAKDEG